MSRHFARLLALAGLMAVGLSALAQVAPAPAVISFQGRLTNPAGSPVADGSFTVTVSLWDAATGGNQKWSQTLSDVSVRNGVFSALLTTDTAGLFNGANLWLQVAVAGDPAMTPRQQIASVPFALKANTVPDAAIGSGQLASDIASLNKVSGGAMNVVSNRVGIGTNAPGQKLEIANGAIRFSNPATTGAKTYDLNYQPAATGPTVPGYFFVDQYGSARRLIVQDDTGYLGLNVTNPGFPLSFPDSLGDKISLWGQSGNHFGLGIAPSLLQIHADAASSDIAFGYGKSSAMTEIMRIKGNGNVGIGTNSPGSKLTVLDTGFPTASITSSSGAGTWLSLVNSTAGGHNWNLVSSGSGNGEGPGGLLFNDQTSGGTRMMLTGTGNLGIGVVNPDERLVVNGRLAFNRPPNDQADSGKIDYRSFDGNSLSIVGTGMTDSNRNVRVYDTLSVGYTAPFSGVAAFNGDVGIGTDNPSSELDVNGEITANVVTVVGGSDVAEPYNVAPAGDVQPEPGMVVCIDRGRVGSMKVSARAYDRRVAGILSGANGIAPGITLRHKGTVADGEMPVASIGRVWALCDADAGGPIEAGDLLTTSDTPGHAMKAVDGARADGAVIGKAMSDLPAGKGLVLVLVSLK
jgi:hypothetical protein